MIQVHTYNQIYVMTSWWWTGKKNEIRNKRIYIFYLALAFHCDAEHSNVASLHHQLLSVSSPIFGIIIIFFPSHFLSQTKEWRVYATHCNMQRPTCFSFVVVISFSWWMNSGHMQHHIYSRCPHFQHSFVIRTHEMRLALLCPLRVCVCDAICQMRHIQKCTTDMQCTPCENIL